MSEKEEKLFPIRVNPEFCIRCQRCQYSCPPKAIFFRDSQRFVDYNKCRGCLKCVEVCEHGAIEVETFFGQYLVDLSIDQEKCQVCKKCVTDNFCYGDHGQLFKIKKNPQGEEYIFLNFDLNLCQHCLKCVDQCPNDALIPEFSD
ncbi:MAG: 4Fe-4S binding protein [Promethearchaeia archaeon]